LTNVYEALQVLIQLLLYESKLKPAGHIQVFC